jgi:signal transduction histidine kinase
VIGGKCDDGQLIFSISDDGRGFDALNQANGNGLRNMQERANESNMLLDLHSNHGEGTYISMQYRITQ